MLDLIVRLVPREVANLVPAALKRRVKDYFESREIAGTFGAMAYFVPHTHQMFDGPQDIAAFKSSGEEFFGIYKSLCEITRDEVMLDVGSGIGRKTLPLTQYFSPNARYEGIDITAAGVAWCAERYTPRFPNFHFQQIDVYNKFYNPTGRYQAGEYRFPFEDNTFTFVALGSVFTHMLPDDLTHYLSEIARVMKPGGRCLISCFMLNEESTPLIGAGKSTQNLRFGTGVARVVSEEVPEIAIGFDETWLLDQYRGAGLTVTAIRYGSWCGRSEYFSYQDLIMAVKP